MSIFVEKENIIRCDIEGCNGNDSIHDSDLPIIKTYNEYHPDIVYKNRQPASVYFRKKGWKTAGCNGHICPKCAKELKSNE